MPPWIAGWKTRRDRSDTDGDEPDRSGIRFRRNGTFRRHARGCCSCPGTHRDVPESGGLPESPGIGKWHRFPDSRHKSCRACRYSRPRTEGIQNKALHQKNSFVRILSPLFFPGPRPAKQKETHERREPSLRCRKRPLPPKRFIRSEILLLFAQYPGCLFHNQIILHGCDPLDAACYFHRFIGGLLRINEAAQLNGALEGFDADLK